MERRIFNVLLYTFVILVPIMPLKSKIGSIPLAADFVFGGLLIIFGLICVIKDFENVKFKFRKLVLESKLFRTLTIVICLFTILSFASVLYSKSASACISEGLRFLQYVLIFFLILLFCTKRELNNIIKLFGASMFIAACYGIVQFVFNFSEFKDITLLFNRGRIFATFVNPDYWGAAVNLVIFLPLCILFKRKEYSKNNIIISVVYFILMFVNLVLTLTRGSWLGFAVGIVIISLLEFRRGLIYIFAAGALSMIPGSIRHRILSAFSLKSFTNYERLRLWKTGWYMFKDHIWTGVGNGNYNYNYYDYVLKHKEELDLRRTVFTVHNSYLKMFAELGIFGGLGFLAIYLMLAGIVLKVYIKSKGYLRALSLALIGFYGAYLFQNFFNNLMFIPQLNVFVWIFTAVVYKYYLIENGEIE